MNAPMFLSIAVAIAFLLFSSEDACKTSNEHILDIEKIRQLQSVPLDPNNIPEDEKKHYIKNPSPFVEKQFKKHQKAGPNAIKAAAADNTECKQTVNNAQLIYILEESNTEHKCDASLVALPTDAPASHVFTTRASCLGVKETEIHNLYLPCMRYKRVKVITNNEQLLRVKGVVPYPSLAVADDFAVVMVSERDGINFDKKKIEPGCIDSRYRAWVYEWVFAKSQSDWTYPDWLYL